MADKLKFLLAVILLAAGIAGFYFINQAMIFRVLAVLAGVIAAVAVAWFTTPGQQFFGFAKESTVEVKKVVWPSRKETVQMTGIVFAFACTMALFLWLVDISLQFIIYDLILRRNG